VLVAAHCVDMFSVEVIAIVAGVHTFTDSILFSNFYPAESIIVHENYAGTKNDIALIKLRRKVTLSSTVQIICLPTQDLVPDLIGKNVVATGWGVFDTNKPNEGSNVLMETVLQIQDHNLPTCKLTNYDSNLIHCTLDTNNSPRSGICFGDSGGPLMHFVRGRWYVYGIASFILTVSNNTCDTRYPSYWTNVVAYETWISNKLLILTSNTTVSTTTTVPTTTSVPTTTTVPTSTNYITSLTVKNLVSFNITRNENAKRQIKDIERTNLESEVGPQLI